MATKATKVRIAYGIGDDLIPVPPQPIIANRAPRPVDKAELGALWVDKATDSAYLLTTVTGGSANWEPLGGALTVEHIDGNTGQSTPASGVITFTGTQGAIFTAGAAAVTESFQRLELGASAARFTATGSGFSTADGNAIQSYVSTSGGTVGTTFKAISGDLLVVSGNASESPQGVSGSLTIGASASVEEGFAGYFLSTQISGTTNVDSNLVGCFGKVLIEEATAGDQPQVLIAGSESIVAFDAAAAAPTAAIVCASLNDVNYDAAMDGVAHGVVISRTGAGAGVSAGSAIKVINGAGVLDDWTYGLDLYNDSAQDYATADVRLWNQATIISAAAGVTFTSVAGDDWILQMGDNAAANKVSFTDSDGAEVAFIDSNGAIDTVLTITSGTGISATTGDITADAGDIVATLGAGDFATTVTAGTGVSATTGDITADAGDLVATLGAGDVATTLTAGTGISATTGDITADAGNLVATLGSGDVATTLTAGTGITATTGDITASTGDLVSTLGAVDAATTITSGTGISATTGNITADAGDLVATLGAGNVATTLTAGTGIAATTGNITADAGNFVATLGSVGAATTVTAGTGIAATTGDITADAGDLVATLGAGDVATTLTAGTGITATTGDIAASSGNVTASASITATQDIRGRTLFAVGDEGTGVASQTALTNVVDTTLSSGEGVVLMKTTNPGNSAGWIKMYVGTGVVYIPYWSNISP